MHLLNGVLPVGYINKKAINRCTFVLLTQTGAQVLTCIAMVNCDRGDYETRLTSKEQTKMSRFMLEAPRPYTIFCFVPIHYA